MFVYQNSKDVIIIFVYVDDIFINGNDTQEISSTKTYLASQIKTNDLGILRYFLGIEVSHNKGALFLSQRKYVIDLLT